MTVFNIDIKPYPKKSQYTILFALMAQLILYQMPLPQILFGSLMVQVLKIIFFLLLLSLVLGRLPAIILRNKAVIAYFIVLLAMIPGGIMSGMDGVIQVFSMLIRIFCFPLFIAAIYSLSVDFTLDKIKWLGLILSIQSILLFILIILGKAGEPSLVERFGPDDLMPSYGIMGFAGWLTDFGDGDVGFRVQSFFSEATKFAMFLFLPLFICLGSRPSKRKVINLSIIVIALALTFSFTAFISVFVALFIREIFNIISRGKSLFVYLKLTLIILGASLLFTLISISFDDRAQKNGPSFIAIATQKNEGSIEVRQKYVENILNIISDNPMGVAEAKVSDDIGKLPAAPFRWFLWAGVGGGLLMNLFQLFIIVPLCIDSIRRGSSSESWLATGVLAFMSASIVHGNWVDLDYFLIMAILFNFRRIRLLRPNPVSIYA